MKDPAKTEFLWFLLIIGFFGFLWLIMGGPLNPNSTRPFLEPPRPLNYGGVYGEDNLNYGSTTIRIGPPNTSGTPEDVSSPNSSLRSKIKIEYVQADWNNSGDPTGEYIALWADYNNTEPIKITGLKLRSKVTNNSVIIPGGTKVFTSGSTNLNDPAYIYPGESVYIYTGQSPLGVSFQVNKCMGYLSRFQRNLSVSTNCPLMKEEKIPAGVSFNDQCLDFVESVGRCETVTDFKYLPYECQTFVAERANYSGCVNYHRNDKDFLYSDWRMYLNRSQSLWKDRREIVELLDANGRLIDYYSY